VKWVVVVVVNCCRDLPTIQWSRTPKLAWQVFSSPNCTDSAHGMLTATAGGTLCSQRTTEVADTAAAETGMLAAMPRRWPAPSGIHSPSVHLHHDKHLSVYATGPCHTKLQRTAVCERSQQHISRHDQMDAW